jgi:hypothetical protein
MGGMMCKCGAELRDTDLFCPRCGLPVPEAKTKLPTGFQPRPTTPYFGRPKNRWWLPFHGKSDFPRGYEWLDERNTLLICADHLVLLQGD